MGFGVPSVLRRPEIKLFNAAGVQVASNIGWRSGDLAGIQATGLAPTNDDDCALLLRDIPAGAYTAVLSGVNETTGNALIEVYEVP